MMTRYRVGRFVVLSLFLLVCVASSMAADLKPNTETAFRSYVTATEVRMRGELQPGGKFLYVDGKGGTERDDSYRRLKAGEILVDKLETKSSSAIKDMPDGMVHHWVGLVFIPGVSLAQVLPVVQDYDHRAELYKPEVIASKLVAHQGDDYKIFLRLYQKKFTTVIFNTDYDVHWGEVDPHRMFSNSISTRIAEVKDSSRPDGPAYEPGHGTGYLWNLNTYWRFEEKDG